MVDLQTAASILLTLALVLITAYYAWQNRRMVDEMREARIAQILPRLRPTVHSLGAGLGRLRVVNVGPGPAIDVDLEIRMEPGNDWVVRWTAPVIGPGEHHDFWPRDAGQSTGAILRLDALTERYQDFRIIGSMQDVVGRHHVIDERFEIREWWSLIVLSGRNLDRDWTEQSAKHLETIAKEIRKFNSDRRNERIRASYTWRDRFAWWREGRQANLRARVGAAMRGLRRADHGTDVMG